MATLVFAASTHWQHRAMASAVPGAGAASASSAGSLPAYLPELNVKALAAGTPAKAPSGGFFQLTPAACSSAGCTGFRLSNSADFSSRINTATFTPNSKTALVDPWNIKTYELGSFQLTNGDYAVPADGGAALVPMSVSVQVATQGSGKSTAVTIPFQVMWSPGSPAPPNNAGLFVLVTKASGSIPAPTKQFEVGMIPGIDFKMQLDLVGFLADAEKGKDVTVLGDWGQQSPAAGQPGARAYVKRGSAAQTVKLMGRITKLD